MTAQEELSKLRPELRYLRIKVQTEERGRFAQKNKAEKLEKELKIAKSEIKRLKEELEKIKKQRDTYKGMIFKPKVTQESEADGIKRKLGGQLGHMGVSRKVPVNIDQVVRCFLKVCPDCQVQRNTPLPSSGA